MFCHKCGRTLIVGSYFCSHCGACTPGDSQQNALAHRSVPGFYQNPNLQQGQGHYQQNLQQQQGPQFYQHPQELQQTSPGYQTTHYLANQETYTRSTTAVYYQGNPMDGGNALPTGQGQAMLAQPGYVNYAHGYPSQAQGQPSSFPSQQYPSNLGPPHSGYQDQRQYGYQGQLFYQGQHGHQGQPGPYNVTPHGYAEPPPPYTYGDTRPSAPYQWDELPRTPSPEFSPRRYKTKHHESSSPSSSRNTSPSARFRNNESSEKWSRREKFSWESDSSE